MPKENEYDWTHPLLTHLAVFETSTAHQLCCVLKCICENLDPMNFTPSEVEESFNALGGKCRHDKNHVPNHFDETHLAFLQTVKLIVPGAEEGSLAVADQVLQLYDPAPKVVAFTDDDEELDPSADPDQIEVCVPPRQVDDYLVNNT